MNTVLHSLLVRAAQPASAFPGQAHMRFARPIAVEVLRCFVTMCDGRATSSGVEGDRLLRSAFTDIARRDPSLVADTLQRLKVDATNPSHGHRLAFVATVLTGPLQDETVAWAGFTRHAELGLAAAAWRARELRTITAVVGRAGSYPPTFPSAVERFVAARLAVAPPSELGHLSAMLASLSETRSSPLLKTISDRAATMLGTTMPMRTVGSLCRSFLRAQFHDVSFIHRVCETLTSTTPPDGMTAVSVFVLWGQVGFKASAKLVTPNDEDEGPAVPPALPVLLKAIAEWLPGNDDVETLLLLFRGLKALPIDTWTAVHADVDGVLVAIAGQCEAFLECDPPVPSETLSTMLARYSGVAERRPRVLAPLPDLGIALEAFGHQVKTRAEELMAEASPPFFVVAALLDCAANADLNATAPCRGAAMALLAEAHVLDVAIPTLQIMRLLVQCGDHNVWTRESYLYLRKNFALTMDGIPLVQLCTALTCLASAASRFPARDADERLELETFVSDVVAAFERQQSKYRMDLRCVMRAMRCLNALGLPRDVPCTQRFYNVVARRLPGWVESADAAGYSKVDAAGCISLLKSVAPVPDEAVLSFFDLVASTGTDDSGVRPSAWMAENDPSSRILERSPEQQQVDALLARMRLVPVDDLSALNAIAAEYMKLLKHVHADEVRFIFELFAERVIKNDRVLRDCIDHLLTSGAVQKLSPFSVASMLQNAAAIRFAYTPLVKRLLAAITDEQWSLIDPIELEMTLVGLQRLGIRVAAVMVTLGEKALHLAPTMTAAQAASLVAAFQALGFHEEAVLSTLVQRASEGADAMSTGALAAMLGGPHAHRLPLPPSAAEPLLRRLTALADEFAPHQRSRIVTTLKKTGLPQDLLLGATQSLTRIEGSPATGAVKELAS